MIVKNKWPLLSNISLSSHKLYYIDFNHIKNDGLNQIVKRQFHIETLKLCNFNISICLANNNILGGQLNYMATANIENVKYL